MKKDSIFSKITIEAAENGWIVTKKNKTPQIFVRWEAVVSYLKSRLTTERIDYDK